MTLNKDTAERFDKKFVHNHGNIEEWIPKVHATAKSIKDFLASEIELAEKRVHDEIKKAVLQVSNYPHDVYKLYDNKMPWVIFGGDATEEEKRTIYQMAFNDCISLFKKHLLKTH